MERRESNVVTLKGFTSIPVVESYRNYPVGKFFFFYPQDNQEVLYRIVEKVSIPLTIVENDFVEIKGIVQKELRLYSHLTVRLMVALSIKKLPLEESTLCRKGVNISDFHISSKYSTLDSVIDLGFLAKVLLTSENKKLFICDNSSLQAIPSGLEICKKNGLELYSGVEFNVVDDSKILKIRNGIKFVSLSEIDFLVLDLETSGVNPFSDVIIEVGYFLLKNGKVYEEFSSLVSCEKELSKEFSDFTGIRKEDLLNKPLEKEILEKIRGYFKEHPNTIFVSHSDFDLGFLKKRMEYHGLGTFNPNFLDTLQLSRCCIKDLNKFTLESICRFLGINAGNYHRAAVDARYTTEVLTILLEKKEYLNNSLDNLLKAKIDIFFVQPERMILYPRSKESFKDLFLLLTLSLSKYFYKSPRIPRSILEKYRSSFIFISSFTEGEIATKYFRGLLSREELRQESFYDYIEVLPLKSAIGNLNSGFSRGVTREIFLEKEIKQYYSSLPEDKILISSNAKFIFPQDEIARRIMLSYRENKYRDIQSELFFKRGEELIEELNFSEVLQKSSARNIAKFEEEIVAVPKDIIAEFYPTKDEKSDLLIENLSNEKRRELYGEDRIVRERLEKEISLVRKFSFSYFYLVARELIEKIKEKKMFFSSRGSIGSSLLGFFLGITEVNPLPAHYFCPKCKITLFFDGVEFGLDLPDRICDSCNQSFSKDGSNIKFEIFSGLSGEKMPDIDLNFSGAKLEEIHEYFINEFNKDSPIPEKIEEVEVETILNQKVCRSGTILTIKERNAATYVEKFRLKNLEGFDLEVLGIVQPFIQRKLLEVKIADGQHPGGLFLIPKERNVFDYTPVQTLTETSEKKNYFVTHFSYHDLDRSLFKMDILGHDVPSFLYYICQHNPSQDPNGIDLSDRRLIEIFRSPDPLNISDPLIKGFDLFDLGVFGLPEFSTNFVLNILRELKPATFCELVKISGLTHGIDLWRNNIQDLIKSKKMKLSDAFTSRDDILEILVKAGLELRISYQIMEFIRKGKCKLEKFREEKDKIVEILKKTGMEDFRIESLLKISYIFPKAHAVAYVLSSLKLAYYKIYYPSDFYIAFLNTKMKFADYIYFRTPSEILIKDIERLERVFIDQKTRNEVYVREIILEARGRGIEFLPIDIYLSKQEDFSLEKSGIRLPFLLISGFSRPVAEKIIEEREKSQFLSEEDFRNRVGISQPLMKLLKEYDILKLKSFQQRRLF